MGGVMDIQQSVQTWGIFTSLVKWGTILVVLLLIILALTLF